MLYPEWFVPYQYKEDLEDINVERIKSLIEFLNRLPEEHFNMSAYVKDTECGTVACIAGWEGMRLGYTYIVDTLDPSIYYWISPQGDNISNIIYPSGESLGLSKSLYVWLFYGYFDQDVYRRNGLNDEDLRLRGLKDISLPEAIYALEWLLDKSVEAQT